MYLSIFLSFYPIYVYTDEFVYFYVFVLHASLYHSVYMHESIDPIQEHVKTVEGLEQSGYGVSGYEYD